MRVVVSRLDKTTLELAVLGDARVAKAHLHALGWSISVDWIDLRSSAYDLRRTEVCGHFLIAAAQAVREFLAAEELALDQAP